ncbi:uncharacterized protein [Gossypium hirsutum]|uniref:Retrotransposon gag domain-containing protein n=1 Tax=Gossypium hirsutum TaxID=3635 RepID=A0ABM2ZBP1_GOSHI|nr:uncharacterized protein LOC121211194 [Gossypium hirsutum]
MPVADAPVPPATEVESYDRGAGDDVLSQAMLRVLERVSGASIGNRIRGSIFKRLRANRAEIFKGVFGVAPNVAEYWLKATEWIMDELDCSVEQKLKGAVSLLREKAYQWWLITAFKGKYVEASYVDASRKEFLNLVQGVKTVAEYKVEFLRLSWYAVGIVATEYECNAKIAEEVKRAENQNREKDQNHFGRDPGPSGGANRNVKRARVEEPHKATLDSATKRMVLRTAEGEEVVVIGERRDYLSNVVLALRAKKWIRKGSEAYLAFVS